MKTSMIMDKTESVGERLRKEIKEKIEGGMDQVAIHLGVTRTTVYNWIAKNNIPANKLNKLIEYGIDILYVFTGEIRNPSQSIALEASEASETSEEVKEFSIGERLRDVIRSKNMKLTEFSEVSNIPYTTLQQYLADDRKPGVDVLIKISTRLHISIDWLLTGEGKMFHEKAVENVDTSKKTIKWLNQWWENADEKQRNWLEVQMKYYFPDYAAWLAEEENKLKQDNHIKE